MLDISQPPTCIAATQEAIYLAFSYTRADRLAIGLYKSPRVPSPGIRSVAWAPISSTTNPVLTANIGTQGHSQDTECYVDGNGVFTMSFYHNQTATNIRYDPTPLSPLTNSENNTIYDTYGRWSTAKLTQSADLSRAMELLLQPEDSLPKNIADPKDIVTVYYQPGNKAAFHYAHVKSANFNINVTDSDLVQVQLANVQDSVYNIAYGDGTMFVILKGSSMMSLPDTSMIGYNKSLAFFPFQAPYTLPSPLSTGNVPWNVGCAESYSSGNDVGATAVANGKLYYLCESNTSSATLRLYTYDSRTLQFEGPYELSQRLSDYRMTLVYGTAVKDYPQFILLNTIDKAFAIDLANAKVGSTLYLDDITNALPVAWRDSVTSPTNDECRDSCGHVRPVVGWKT
ncbi:hypothetical protein BGZ81_002866 [Podila clonocystis]|nr:hypothetical protein BGZ81_002866 [Podila clonocystis]